MLRKIILSTAALLCAAASWATKPIKAPAFLRPGDKIAIITPASAIDTAAIDTAVSVLTRWGFKPQVGKYALERLSTGFAGTVAQRKADLLWALRDPSIKAILCSRGGYGSVHLLCEIPLKEFSQHPKWIIGYSDITALHSAQVRAGNMSIHANMAEPLGYADTTSRALHELLLGKLPSYTIPANKYNHAGVAKGILVGGNMSVYGNIAESDYDFLRADFLKTHDVVLFIEDVSERYDSVDRMLHMLMIRGVLHKIKGLIIGHFTDYKPVEGYDSMEDMIHRYIGNLNIPVCYGFPVGHIGKDNFPMIEGCPVTLTVGADSSTLQFHLNRADK